jgi:uncharacterized repeat protein (TIGR01451 family)
VKRFLRVWLCLIAAFVALATHRALAATPAGTIISNTASLTYSDANGVAQKIESNTLTATVATVSAVAVGPKETGCNPQTDSVPAKQPFIRTFTVTNGGNVPDTYTITATTTVGTVTNLSVIGAGGATTALANGGTLPQLAPGAVAQIAVTVNPGTAANGTNVEVSLTATSTSPASPGSDTASQCAIIASGTSISGPGGAGTPVLKLVNGEPLAEVLPGATVTYSIAFMNSGALVANDIVVTDAVPAGITPDLGTVQVNGVAVPPGSATLSGQTLTVTIASLAPGAHDVVTFAALVTTSTVVGQTYVNTVTIVAYGVPPAQSTPASVFVGVGNIVYDGLAGQSAPVAGATLTLTQGSGTAMALSSSGFPPNTTNADPYVTGSSGAYAFAIGANQIGSGTYSLTISAPGYLNRKIGLKLVPNALGTLYTVTLTALDGQLLATAGGFSLVHGPVTLANVYGLFGNLPLFRAQNITVTKTVDRSFASSGDRLVYTVTFANAGTPLGSTTVVDTLPPGVVYAPGTGRVDGVHAEPKIVGRVLTWTLTSLAIQHVITYAAVILPGTEENQVLTNEVVVTAQSTNDPAITVSASAAAQTQVVAGVFTDRTVVTGRVFYDVRGTGRFVAGDVGIGGVRIYLEDGESVVTDTTGRYDFPGVEPGMHVLKLDPSTLPSNAKPYADANFSWDDERSTRRLLHGVFDGGILEDINFALRGTP